MFLLLLSSAYPKSSVFQLVSPVGKAEWGHRKLGGDAFGQLTQTVQGDIPYHGSSHHSVRFLLPCPWVGNSCFPGIKVGTELVCAPISFCESCLIPGALLLRFISLVLVTCLVHFLCESEPQISALKICNILVSTSWGFAWISACQQGWPNFWLGLGPISVVLFGGHASEEELSCQAVSAVSLVGDIRWLDFVVNNSFLTVCRNKKQHTVIIWKKEDPGRSFSPALPRTGP